MGRIRHPNHRELATLPVELRRAPVPDGVRAWVRRHTGAAVVRTVRLQGASSAAIHRVDLADGRRVVLRRYVWRGFVDSEPDAPGREADAMRFAHAHGLPAPEVLASDPTGAEVGDGVPVLLMTLLPGLPRGDPDPLRLAETAAAIHAVDSTGLGHHYFAWCEAEMATPPPMSRQPALWEKAVELWREAQPHYDPVLIHRDFHPGNVLWARQRMTGVVDWANACRGPAGCDLATCWRNLADWAGRDSADRFVAAYAAITGDRLDPYWRVASILESGREHWTPENLASEEPELARLVSILT